MTGTPASATRRFTVSLSADAARTSAGGPTKTSPAFSHAAANAAFSLRKP